MIKRILDIEIGDLIEFDLGIRSTVGLVVDAHRVDFNYVDVLACDGRRYFILLSEIEKVYKYKEKKNDD